MTDSDLYACGACGQFTTRNGTGKKCDVCPLYISGDYEPDHDPVRRPNHYNWHPSKVECKTISMHFSHPIGAAIEYLWRAGRKGDHHQHIEDLSKAIECIRIEMERLAVLRSNEDRADDD